MKSYARKERWREEVLLLEEEMRRVLASLEYERGEWVRRCNEECGTDQIASGKHVYALRQATARWRLGGYFKTCFDSSEELGRTGKKRRVNNVAAP